ncbi:MarR family winged helix-turn-helix transcriptional regulator [Kribbella sp. NPDC049227]|uniref:MarR family winged helix-turn-helix transcriptional regulator n=1 Tax=Kribbella sp. NPDC049227 TaxID=3364113 RepID=UPI00371C3834
MTASSNREIVRDRFQRMLPRLLLLYADVAKSAGIPEVALQALHVLTLHDGAMYPAELSAQTGLPRSTVTRVLDTLEEAGFVERVRTPDDGRRFAVHVRSDRVAPISARFDLYADAMTETTLGFTEAELSVIARYWEELNRAVDSRQPSPSPSP